MSLERSWNCWRRRILEEILTVGRNAEVEEERVTVTARSGVTRQAVAGSRSSEAEVELLATALMVEEVRKTQLLLLLVLEVAPVSGRRKSKGTDETVAVGDGRSSEMEGDFLLCEVGGHPKNTEEEQRPLQDKAPPQKRRAVTRVESADTQDDVSAPWWIEEENDEEMEELSFIPSAVSEKLHICDDKSREEGFKFYQLVATVTEEDKLVTSTCGSSVTT